MLGSVNPNLRRAFSNRGSFIPFKFTLGGVVLLLKSVRTHDGSNGSPEDGGSPEGER